MSKVAGGLADLDLDIIQTVDWDPMQVLNENGGKIDDKNFPYKGGGDNNDDDDDDADLNKNGKNKGTGDDDDDNQGDDKNKGKNNKGKTSNQQRQTSNTPDFSGVDLSDEQIQQGLKRDKSQGKVDNQQQQQQQNSSKAKPGQQQQQQNDDGADNKLDPTTNAFVAHYQLMVEGGEWEEMEGFDGTKESYLKAKDYNLQRQLDDQLTDYLEEAFARNPEGAAQGKRLIAHLARGGRVSDFVNLNAASELPFDLLDSDKDDEAEAAALEVLPQYYHSIGWKKAQIDQKLALLKKTGGLIDEAKLVRDPYKEAIETRRVNSENQLKQQAQANRANQAKLNTSLNTMLTAGHAFGSLEIGKNKKSIQEYQTYLFQPVEEGKPAAFAAELQENLKDPEFLLFMAVAMKNKLHKNPEAVANPEKSEQKALDKIESILSKSLLNKDVNKHQHQADGSSNNKNGGSSKYEFDFDNAVPINI